MDAEFTATIVKETKKGGWTYVLWPESTAYLGTGKAVGVEGTIDSHAFKATLLPWGNGSHMLPIKASLFKELNKEAGDSVSVRLHKAPPKAPPTQSP